jgi:hypothetical protein
MSTEQALYLGARAEADDPDSVLLPGHDVPLGRFTTVRRLLPHRQRRMIGAWCFVDHFGPDDVSGRPGMQGAAASIHRLADSGVAGRGRD